MADKTIALFYLGTRGDLDTDEANYNTELAGTLVGTTFGSQDAPLVDTSLTTATLNDSDNNGVLRDNDRDNAPEDEGITHEGTFEVLDNSNLYHVTVNFTDGSSAQTSMIVVQDVGGRLFLMPRSTGSSANEVLDDAPIQSVTLDALAISNATGVSTGLDPDAFVTCYVAGTLIDCATGARRIETLKPGDKVRTLDHGLQVIRAINDTVLPGIRTAAPIMIAKGALGQGVPQRALWVSPQHRILVRSRIAGRLFGEAEVLVPAIRLVSLPGISQIATENPVHYHHLLCDRHELVRANGAWAETLYLGEMALHRLSRLDADVQWQQIAKGGGPAARQIATGLGSRMLTARHCKNGQPLLQW